MTIHCNTVILSLCSSRTIQTLRGHCGAVVKEWWSPSMAPILDKWPVWHGPPSVPLYWETPGPATLITIHPWFNKKTHSIFRLLWLDKYNSRSQNKHTVQWCYLTTVQNGGLWSLWSLWGIWVIILNYNAKTGTKHESCTLSWVWKCIHECY